MVLLREVRPEQSQATDTIVMSQHEHDWYPLFTVELEHNDEWVCRCCGVKDNGKPAYPPLSRERAALAEKIYEEEQAP